MRLTEPVALGPRTAPSRVVFGPHETNLARGRALSDRHVAYYARRAAGGAGLIVTETASVHPSDWPYERAPLAAECGPGWAATAAACAPYGALVVASLGHAGSQGSSAYHQSALWAPSRVADVVSRELPMELEEDGLDALRAGFGAAARLAADSGLDGVEVEAGQFSLLRQFLSGLTNQRQDAYGTDRPLLLRQVLTAVRAEVGDGRLLGLRLSGDELAPWAGITPRHAEDFARELAPLVDYLVVVRGSAMATSATRPDFHTRPAFNTELCAAVRTAVAGRVPVVLQGSVTRPALAEEALTGGVADLVEMTRAQIADPELVALVRSGLPERVRPCVLCNQKCRVRDNRNPVVSCAVDPRSGHETEDPPDIPRGRPPAGAAAERRTGAPARPGDVPAGTSGERRPDAVLVVGGGPAGLEAARVLAAHGRPVELVERAERLGGMLRVAGERWTPLLAWLEAEVRRLGVVVRTSTAAGEEELAGRRVVLATGSRPGPRRYDVDGGTVLEAADVLAGRAEVPDGPVLVDDPVGDATGVALAERLAAAGAAVSFVTQDPVAGTQLALTGDLADAHVRLTRAGVTLLRRTVLRSVSAGAALVEDVLTGEQRKVGCAAVVHCGHRLPDTALTGPEGTVRAGDRVAPRTVHEALLEGRRAALALCGADGGAAR
ncbi:mycofactocin system FadH/OYE family oxidoreductase 1 [Streptomyces sp. NPDC021356]|uniref:mycofactocin system FadH/OYE family oxidoreductase 1 n=1 Tax=Streptomyces sp. NPDC021356 TaxID=3154900 RepID=UPI0033F1E042